MKKKLIITALASFMSLAGFAQNTAVEKSFAADPFNHPMLSTYLTMGFLVLVVLVAAAAVVAIVRAIKAITSVTTRSASALGA